MWNLRNDTNELTKQEETLRERIYGCWGEGWGTGIVREFGVDMCTLRYYYFKWTNNKDLYSTCNSAQCCVADWMEGALGV